MESLFPRRAIQISFFNFFLACHLPSIGIRTVSQELPNYRWYSIFYTCCQEVFVCDCIGPKSQLWSVRTSHFLLSQLSWRHWHVHLDMHKVYIFLCSNLFQSFHPIPLPCALAFPPPSHRDATTPSPCWAPHFWGSHPGGVPIGWSKGSWNS